MEAEGEGQQKAVGKRAMTTSELQRGVADRQNLSEKE